ncbi:MAG: tryptophan--tRNA ligase [marine bacterium B5-7]|nr:MAG: tryptophan--tRNA ligase [marine bacterium B5-7]
MIVVHCIDRPVKRQRWILYINYDKLRVHWQLERTEAPLSTHQRIVSGMRPTGHMHLGHYHGVLKNWVKLQYEQECLFFAADLHALTTHYDETQNISQHTWDMVVDWLAAGVDPNASKIFIQSHVPQHAELHLLLSMVTPLSWLERVPTYKEQIEKLKEKDLTTYGFLGYPVLMSSDVLLYRATHVPVGEDQVPHVELTREIARHFNHLFGREPDYVEKAEAAITKLGKKSAKLYRSLLKNYQEQGDQEALETGQALLAEQANISLSDKERLLGFLEGGGKIILPEPQAALTEQSKLLGLDGQKMSKSYKNTVMLRDTPEDIEKKIRVMPTDPARVRRTDAGDPEKCPVWQWHQTYSDKDTQDWVQQGCRSAGIGCLDCKKPLIEKVQAEVEPMQARAKPFIDDPSLVRDIVAEGCEAARDLATDTLNDVREAIGLPE